MNRQKYCGVMLWGIVLMGGVTGCVQNLDDSATQAVDQKSLLQQEYQRAHHFIENSSKLVHQQSLKPHAILESNQFWYIKEIGGTQQYIRVDTDTMTAHPLFDHVLLATSLGKLLEEDLSADELPIRKLKFLSKDELSFESNKKRFTLELSSNQLKEQQEAESPEGQSDKKMESRSPDGKWIAFSRNYNLYVRSTETGKERQLSFSGKKNYEYASRYDWADIIEGENGERPERFNVSWSPDSKKLATQIVDLRDARKMYLLDPTGDERFRPKLLSYYRGSPGDQNIVKYTPVLFDVQSGKESRIDLPSSAHFNRPSLSWSQDSDALWGTAWKRGYKEMRAVRVDAETGAVETLFEDKSDTNLVFTHFNVRFLHDLDTMLISSASSGWNQLYRVNLKTREVLPVTRGEYVVKSIFHVNEKDRKIYFTAAGREKGNPYLDHLYRGEL